MTSILQPYEAQLAQLAAADPAVVVVTAENRAAIRNLPAVLGERFIDVGVAEQTMIGLAAGLALRGRKPIVHALACFLTMRAYEFIRTDVGIGNLPVKLVGGVPGFLSDGNGPTHQAIEDGISDVKLLFVLGLACVRRCGDAEQAAQHCQAETDDPSGRRSAGGRRGSTATTSTSSSAHSPSCPRSAASRPRSSPTPCATRACRRSRASPSAGSSSFCPARSSS